MAVTELAAKRDEELCDVIEDLWFRARLADQRH
jgi:hypothetical protein